MRRRVSAELIVCIGQVLGVLAAEEIYLGLAQEPVDPDGQRIDWLVIAARIRMRVTGEVTR